MITRLAELAQTIKITAHKSFLFQTRPVLQLGLTLARFQETRTYFNAKQCEGRIERGRSAGVARGMIIKTLFKIGRSADVKHAGS